MIVESNEDINSLVQHFEKLGKPLDSFIRVSANKYGEVLEIKTVYKGVL